MEKEGQRWTLHSSEKSVYISKAEARKIMWVPKIPGVYHRPCCCSVAQSCSTLCDLMDTRLPCPLPTPGACSNSYPLSRWCHPTILSSVVPFSSCLQSFPASGSFLMSQLFASGGQSIGVSASASVLAVNIQDWSLLCLENRIFVWLWHVWVVPSSF